MKCCGTCGGPVDDVGKSNFDKNVDKPPYVKPEKVLREEEHHTDFMFLRNLASSIGKGTTGKEWEKTKALRGKIIRDWPTFALLKYGKERGIDCKAPLDTKWEKAIHVDDWALARFSDDQGIFDALIDFMEKQEG